MKPLNSRRAIELVMRLLAIPGKSCEELAIAYAVVDLLRQAGVPESCIAFDTAHKRTPTPGQVGNLIVKLPGGKKLPRLMLSAHLDTVPICVGCEPKKVGDLIRSSNTRTGLGGDDRAGVAAVLTAAIETLESPEPHPPLTLCFFVQEEIGLQGSRHLTVSKLGNPQLAFNFDGGDPFKLTVGATGGERMRVRLYGIPAHAGVAPEQGANAITAAALAIAKLHKERWLGAVKKGSQVGTSNVGVIHGGSATNVVTDYVEVAAEARSHDGQFRTAIADAIEQAFVTTASQVKNCEGGAVRAECERRVDYEAFRLDPASLPVVLAERAIGEAGGVAKQSISNGGVDANWLVRHGIPTVTLGCGQRDIHTTHESLAIPDYLTACDIARNIIRHAAR